MRDRGDGGCDPSSGCQHGLVPPRSVPRRSAAESTARPASIPTRSRHAPRPGRECGMMRAAKYANVRTYAYQASWQVKGACMSDQSSRRFLKNALTGVGGAAALSGVGIAPSPRGRGHRGACRARREAARFQTRRSSSRTVSDGSRWPAMPSACRVMPRPPMCCSTTATSTRCPANKPTSASPAACARPDRPIGINPT